ncbi:M20/M25/M40 family metallo-hydrolase [Alphaproteobacteria bacterium]|nr:M20/M25/M40 family metallo-hydrolase [Alphaproteobacteria bacterium]
MKKNIQKELLDLLKQIIEIDTCYPPGSSKVFGKFATSYLKNSGLRIKSYGVDKEKINICVSNYKGLKKSIVFNSHIDTVRPISSEWNSNPFDLKIEKNYSYGLGAVNCKGSAAVHLYLAKNFKNLFPNIKENIDFTFVTDEENLGPDGTKYLKKQKVIKPHTLILGAPTNNNFVIEERGVFWLEINVSGKTSHAGEPHKGVNAIEKSAKIINELNSNFKKFLKRYDIGTHKSTINVGIVSGGENVNVVPSKTRIVVDRRITHKEDVKKAFNEIKNFILKIDRSAKVKFLTGTNPFKSNKSNIYLKELSKSKELITGQKSKFLSSIGVSDGRYFADDNVNIINIGPGTGSEGHKSNEKLINKDLVDYFLLLENFLLKF